MRKEFGKVTKTSQMGALIGLRAATCAMVALYAAGAFAGDVITWTGNGANNYWGTSANWDLNRAPSAANDDHVHIPSGDWTIRINDNPRRVYGKIFIDDGEGTVTLLGKADAGTIFFAGLRQ